jgi:AAA family ATPase
MNGFSIGEIKQIIREAYSKNNNKISKESIEVILKNYKPSEIKELIVEVPEVYWKDIGGYEHVKS